MTNTQKHDLRGGKPGADGSTNQWHLRLGLVDLAGHQDKVMPTSPSNEHAVNPGIGSKGGVAEGQVTKSN